MQDQKQQWKLINDQSYIPMNVLFSNFSLSFDLSLVQQLSLASRICLLYTSDAADE